MMNFGMGLMVTEKDKTIRELMKKLDERSVNMRVLCELVWDAAEASGRADAIEECAKITEDEKVDQEGDFVYNAACEHIAFAIRRSLSRKQEEPRPSEKETDRFGKW